MHADARKDIKALITSKLNEKLDAHKSETEYKPFFDAIFNKKQVTLASVIQSFYTSFGMSIYEKMAALLAEHNGFHAETQYILEGSIDPGTTLLIERIHDDLRNGRRKANAGQELKEIRASIKPGQRQKHKDSIVDVYLRDKNGKDYFFGITTVKPNKEGFETHKRKLLRWMALKLSQDKNADMQAAAVIPYNPYFPAPYKRFGSSTLFDTTQLLVQEKFWDFVGGQGSFIELIEVCKEIGKDLRPKIDSL
jgi:hypothetical protein